MMSSWFYVMPLLDRVPDAVFNAITLMYFLHFSGVNLNVTRYRECFNRFREYGQTKNGMYTHRFVLF